MPLEGMWNTAFSRRKYFTIGHGHVKRVDRQTSECGTGWEVSGTGALHVPAGRERRAQKSATGTVNCCNGRETSGGNKASHFPRPVPVTSDLYTARGPVNFNRFFFSFLRYAFHVKTLCSFVRDPAWP